MDPMGRVSVDSPKRFTAFWPGILGCKDPSDFPSLRRGIEDVSGTPKKVGMTLLG